MPHNRAERQAEVDAKYDLSSTEANTASSTPCWTKPLRGRFKASIARAMQDGQKLIS